MQHMQAPIPSLKELRAESPEALDRIIGKGLAKDRANRYQTADEMLEALRVVAAATTLERSMPAGEKERMAAQSAAADRGRGAGGGGDCGVGLRVADEVRGHPKAGTRGRPRWRALRFRPILCR